MMQWNIAEVAQTTSYFGRAIEWTETLPALALQRLGSLSICHKESWFADSSMTYCPAIRRHGHASSK
jgi:hypothetical protein